MNVVYLLLGSNFTDRSLMLQSAKEAIHSRIGHITSQSSIYETEPWGFQSDNLFLNQVVRLETRLLPREILEEILGIEENLGRKRERLNGYTARSIDIDILFYNNDIIEEDCLAIPHPKIAERMFALVPLCEIAQGIVHPTSNKTIGQLVRECSDRLKVCRYDKI